MRAAMWPELGRHAELESQTRERMLPDSGHVKSGIRQSSSEVTEGRCRQGTGPRRGPVETLSISIATVGYKGIDVCQNP